MQNIAIWHKTNFLLIISFLNSIFFYAQDDYVSYDYLKNYVQKSSNEGKAKQELLFFLEKLLPFYEPEEKISDKLIHDLDILNEQHNDFFTIIQRYIKTQSNMGTISLLLSLVHSTMDTGKISEKQKIVTYLMENPHILNFCEKIIALVAMSESSIYFVLSESDNHNDFDDFFNLLKSDTKNNFFYKPISLLGQSIFSWCCGILCGYFLAHPNFVGYLIELINQKQLKNTLQLSCGLGAISIIGLQSVITYQNIKHYMRVTDELRNYFLHIAEFFRVCLLLSRLVDIIPELKEHSVFNFFDEFFQHEHELNEVRLYTEKIKNSYSFFSVLQSESLCVAYKKLWNAKKKMKAVFHMIGQLDAYVAIAKLMLTRSSFDKALADKEKDPILPFCFAEFIHEETPCFEVKNSWNPLLLTHKNEIELVCSDFVLGSQHVHIAIITGPNTSGKTAITTGFALSILLSQTLGICPASHIKLTPFNHVKILLPVGSKIIEGNSKFKTEIQEIMQLLKELKNHNQNNEYIFVVLDEIMSGTDNDTAILIAREFLNTLLQEHIHNKSLIILSTHYHELTNLAQENKQCQNYTLHVLRKQDGSIQRTFKLIPGTCDTVRIAMDLFKEEIKSVLI